jgi:hypothetical protein
MFGILRDIRAMLRWAGRAERAALRQEARMVSTFTPEGAKRYKRWRQLIILILLQRKVGRTLGH